MIEPLDNLHTTIEALRQSPEKLCGDAANIIESMLAMLERFACHGEILWDVENFRDGYKKISSGDLVDCRKLIKFWPCHHCGAAMHPDKIAMICTECNSVLCSG